MKNNGIIYKVTNKINNKIYIGKTKEFYGTKKYGIKGRLKRHISNTRSKNKILRKSCPIFYNAIRKYGKENFYIEQMLVCDLTEYDNHEIAMIKKYNSIDRNIGYNIALGGKGRSVVHISDDVRKKIAKGNKTSNKQLNIKPYFKRGALIGYTVRRRQRGEQYQKWFTSCKYTPGENLKFATRWLADLKSGKLDDVKYNKKNRLPINIIHIKKNNKIVGYRVHIMRNGKKVSKNFQSATIKKNILLERAIKFKKSILNIK